MNLKIIKIQHYNKVLSFTGQAINTISNKICSYLQQNKPFQILKKKKIISRESNLKHLHF